MIIWTNLFALPCWLKYDTESKRWVISIANMDNKVIYSHEINDDIALDLHNAVHRIKEKP